MSVLHQDESNHNNRSLKIYSQIENTAIQRVNVRKLSSI